MSIRLEAGDSLAERREVERQEEVPFWLAMLRIYKELAWRLDQGAMQDQMHEKMNEARKRWLRGDYD